MADSCLHSARWSARPRSPATRVGAPTFDPIASSLLASLAETENRERVVVQRLRTIDQRVQRPVVGARRHVEAGADPRILASAELPPRALEVDQRPLVRIQRSCTHWAAILLAPRGKYKHPRSRTPVPRRDNGTTRSDATLSPNALSIQLRFVAR